MSKPEKIRFKNLSSQLYSGVVILTLLSIAVTGILVGAFYWQTFRTQVIQSQTLREDATSADLNSWMGYAVESLKNYAKLLGYQDLGMKDRITLGNALLRENAAFYFITMYDMNKKPVFSMNQFYNPKMKADFDSVGFQIATENKEAHIGRVIQTEDSIMMSVCISIPILDINNNVTGCLSSILNLRYMKYNVSMIPYKRFGFAYILDEHNNIIASNVTDMKQQENLKAFRRDYFDLLNNKQNMSVYQGNNGGYVIGSYKSIQPFQWFLVVEYPVSFILSQIGNNLILMLIAFILSIVTGIWIARRFYKHIATPLSDLSVAARNISNGNFDVNIKTFATHELGDVATAFNTMSLRLNDLFNNLEMRLKYEKLVAEITFLFVHHHNDDFLELISKTIERIGNFTVADRVLFFFKERDTSKYNCSSQWASSSALANLPEEFLKFSDKEYPWMFFQLSNGFPFILDSDLLNHTVAELLPGENHTLNWMNVAVNETSEFSTNAHQHIKYQISLPFLEKSQLFGFMTIVFMHKQPVITQEEIQLFTTLSNVIGNAVLKTYNQRLLVEERERFRITLLSIGDCVLATTTDGIIQIINPVAAAFLGCDVHDAIGKPWTQFCNIVNSETRLPYDNPIEAVLTQNKTININQNITLITLTGEEHTIELSASPIKARSNEFVGIVLVFRDISEKLKADIEKMRIQKLEAVSFLSAGLAHDFNNLLSAVLGNITLASYEVPEISEVSHYLHIAEDTIIQGKDITAQLLSFAKGSEVTKGNSDLNKLLETTVGFILHGSHVNVTFNIDDNLPLVNMSAGVVNQILTNLVINAMQAMGGYGALAIRAKVYEVTESDELPISPGEYIRVKIRDNGKGISPENLKNIFKPYFTTKEEGTGLGLPTVLTELRKHNGHIVIESKPEKGTTATIYFPLVEDKQQRKQNRKNILNSTPSHVLILEDDVTLRRMMADHLQKCGMTISETSDPNEVIRIIESAQASHLPVRVVLLDLIIGDFLDMTKFAGSIKDTYPSVKLIACSGLIQPHELEKYLSMGFDDILPKPFHIKELQEIISKQLS